MWSVRLTFAGAKTSTVIARHAQGRRALFLEHRVEAYLELAADARRILFLRLEGQGAVPLELGLALAAHGPVDVAEMVVDDRVDGFELDGALHVPHRLVVASEPVERPAETVGDVARTGPGLDGALDEVERLVHVHVHLDEGIAKVVEHL